MKTALEILRTHTGLTVTDPDAVRMQTKVEYVQSAMHEYAIEKVKEALKVTAERANTTIVPNPDYDGHFTSTMCDCVKTIEVVDKDSILSLETELIENIKNEK